MKWLIIPLALLLSACAGAGVAASVPDAAGAPPMLERVQIVVQTARSIQIERHGRIEMAHAPGWPTLRLPAEVCVSWTEPETNATRTARLRSMATCLGETP